MALRYVLLFCLCASLCRAQLATTDDGQQLLLSTFWRLAGESYGPPHSGIYRGGRGAWNAVVHSDQGPVFWRPFLSSDGSVVAWDRSFPCSGSCIFATRRVTEVQGVTPPLSIGTYNLSLSRNARYVLSPGFLGSVDFVLADLSTGRRWTTPEAPTLRALGVANDGAVIGLAASREGGLTNPVVPHRVVVWRPGGEAIDVFQADSVSNAWISADGARALIEVAGAKDKPRELWWVDIATRERRRIAQLEPDGKLDFLDPANHQISNDGSRVVYFWPSQNHTLRLWQSGAEARPLASADEGFLSAVLSGDGRVAWALTAAGRLLRITVETDFIEEVLPALPSRLDPGYAGTIPGSAMVWRAQGGVPRGLRFTSGGLTFPVIDETSRDSVAVQIPWEAIPGVSSVIVQRDGHPFELALPAYIENGIRPVIAGATDDRGTYWIKAAQQDFSSLVTADRPAPAGSTIHTWLYNLGPLDRPVPTGAPGPSDPPAVPLAPFACYLRTAFDTPARGVEIPFLAYAPGLTGVYQADIAIPADWPAGNAILVCESNGRITAGWLPTAQAQ